jgi:hypothetical protein
MWDVSHNMLLIKINIDNVYIHVGYTLTYPLPNSLAPTLELKFLLLFY